LFPGDFSTSSTVGMESPALTILKTWELWNWRSSCGDEGDVVRRK
jgi:hypothetical protein